MPVLTNNQVVALADQLMPAPKQTNSLVYPKGSTPDIVNQILACDRISINDTRLFAQKLRHRDKLQCAENAWNFVKVNILYQVDNWGQQLIKTPARIWAEKICDCKGYSIMLKSLLTNMGIPCYYRFVSYGSQAIWTHVYVVANIEGKQIILDCCMPKFNQEKKYNFKKDLA